MERVAVARSTRKFSAAVALLHIIDTSRLLGLLGEDNRAIVRAASAASKAADYLLAFREPPASSTRQDGNDATDAKTAKTAV